MTEEAVKSCVFYTLEVTRQWCKEVFRDIAKVDPTEKQVTCMINYEMDRIEKLNFGDPRVAIDACVYCNRHYRDPDRAMCDLCKYLWVTRFYDCYC